MSTIILGIGGYSHDASACLIRYGRLIAAVEEERFTRLKHQPGFPHKAIEYCLKEAGITPREIDHIAFYMHPIRGFGNRIWHHVRQMPRFPIYSAGYLVEQSYRRGWAWFELNQLRKLGGGRARIHFVEHHLAHGASSFHVSPFDCAAVLVLDGLGEWTTTTLAIGEGTQLRKLREVKYPHSLGALYGSVTNHLGFKTGDEYKVMGLASFGRPIYLQEMRDLVRLRDDGTFGLNTDYFTFHVQPGRYEGYVSQMFVGRFGPPRKSDESLDQKHVDMAASLQALLEEVVLHIARYLHTETGSENLCIAGGVALNSVMNYRLATGTPFQNIYIQPTANDAGTSLGAAYYVYHAILGHPRCFVMEHAYWGPEYTDDQIHALLEECKVSYSICNDPADVAARLVAEGKIVGWFQGRLEWGPRALGSRSILADPTRPDMTDVVNKYVKHREDFRPFAPSVLEEYGDEYFVNYHPSPYMLEVFPVKPAARQKIPAVVHVDGTSRIQTVSRKTNPLYWRMIDRFRQLKGVPIVLNTSFNVRGEPIVNTPREALRCFYATGMDALVIGRYMIDKGWQPPEEGSLEPGAVGELEVLVG